jgi:arylformamidase
LLASVMIVIFAGPSPGAEMKICRGLAYCEPRTEQQTLDVYSPAEGEARPVVIWLHGGAWILGDKLEVEYKPAGFVAHGYVFVSVNYRLAPKASLKDMATDVAKALRWVHAHAHDYRGAPGKMFVAGHSAGAHLAALVCADQRYLKAEGLSPANIRGCVSVDGLYDVTRFIEGMGPVRAALYAEVFGRSRASQEDFSPIAHIADGKHIPPFFIAHGRRPASQVQSHAFATALQAAGIAHKLVSAGDKNHLTIAIDLGLPGDTVTQAMFEFLRQQLP